MMPPPDGTRDEVYGMLAELFIHPPDEEMASLLLEGPVDVEALAVEFTTLLRGIRETSPPPPYESLYREGVLNGETTMDVVDAYRAFDVQPALGFEGEPADHISFELAFMRHLCLKEAEAGDEAELGRVLEAERTFLGSHLTTWLGGLRGKLEEADGSSFYYELAVFTNEWVESDHILVQDRLMAMGVDH
jgi:TorA maturation chaperone TorD